MADIDNVLLFSESCSLPPSCSLSLSLTRRYFCVCQAAIPAKNKTPHTSSERQGAKRDIQC